jgi:hypothetical protein
VDRRASCVKQRCSGSGFCPHLHLDSACCRSFSDSHAHITYDTYDSQVYTIAAVSLAAYISSLVIVLLKYTRTESASRDYVTHPFEEIASILVPPLINAVFADKSWTVDSVCHLVGRRSIGIPTIKYSLRIKTKRNVPAACIRGLELCR